MGQALDDHVASVEARAHLDHVLLHLAAGLKVVRDDEVGPVCELLCGWLAEIEAGPPVLAPLEQLRQEAAFWADVATPAEIETYVAAGLRRATRTQFAEAARKRLLVALWGAMSPADQRRFMLRVDPDGAFRRGAA
ncbi:hypothetical protein [Pukyongiella litopenaei]|uniref:Uncharacterized protein n=1 Tax=Pukyongiella litopenaei TaxID=2605946 RepID=A0A2S0ML47_9RHOB|nr:hypothetical protein [Pukyongiella litopenaei]AVO36608.1 hypothetical protein C6Y53_02110 [Pukyongiella litopenaei]